MSPRPYGGLVEDERFLVEMPDGGYLEVGPTTDFAHTDPDVLGALGAAPLEDTELITFGAVTRPGLSVQEQDDFADWIYDRVLAFAEVGGEADGWDRLENGTWRVYANRQDVAA